MSRYWPHTAIFGFIIAGIAFPDIVINSVESISNSFLHQFNWFILLCATCCTIFCLYLAFSHYGHIKLGRPDEEPRYSTLSWLAMLFAAGMGAGLVFFGVAEPLFHFHQPPPDAAYEKDSIAAARQAMVLTNLHWGIHAWSVYCACGLVIAYFAFCKDQPLLPSSPLVYSLMQKRRFPVVISLINGIALLAVIFGVVASVGNGIINIESGLERWTDRVFNDSISYVLIITVLAACYLISASTSIGKGIRILSDINMVLCILLMIFVLIAGPTAFSIKTVMASMGDYITQLIPLSFNVRHYTNSEAWTENWTLTYFLWWVAWSPFVGVFIARISRGRTIRQFVLGVIFVPTIFSVVWFSVFGGSAIFMDINQNLGLSEIAVKDPQAASYAFLEHLPFAMVTQLIAVMLMVIFLMTSADSGSYVLGMFSCEGNPNPPVAQRLFWGVVIAVIALGASLSGKGIAMTKTLVVFGSIPFLFILIAQVLSLYSALRKEDRIRFSITNAGLLANQHKQKRLADNRPPKIEDKSVQTSKKEGDETPPSKSS